MSAKVSTAIGNPGHPPAAYVGWDGRVTLAAASWSLDAWMQLDGGNLQVAEQQPPNAIRQRLQDRLPVVATAFEARSLRLSSEAWCLKADGVQWVALQAVVFNLSDDPAHGRCYFALRPLSLDGPGSITGIGFQQNSFYVDGRPAVQLPIPPDIGWTCASSIGSQIPDQIRLDNGTNAVDEMGGCLGLAAYSFHIEPWEEAEFTAFLPLASASQMPPLPAERYGLLKGAATRRWVDLLQSGMQLSLPDMLLTESWDANRSHLLVLANSYLAQDALPTPQELAQDAVSGTDPVMLPAYISSIRQMVRNGSPEAWPAISHLMRLASPTFAWPQLLDLTTGKAGGAHSVEASGEWLRLLRDMLLFESGESLVIGAGFRTSWLDVPGALVARSVPNRYGVLDLEFRWQQPDKIMLLLNTGRNITRGYSWVLPWSQARVEADGVEVEVRSEAGRSVALLPASCESAVATSSA